MSNAKSNKVTTRVARIHAKILALVMAVLCGGALFVMTVWLVIKGGPDAGAHLQLLGQYFIGYSVTWIGSVVGLFYGALVGGLIGWTIGLIYNRIVDL
ncbi:MAG: hypothetical protein HKN13_08020 [Rhodothermales bacterium]|nr:hypothetical protein [Rhodothermales bacterium]